MLPEITQRTLESEARRALASAIASLPGPKALLVDSSLYDSTLSLARPLELFTDATFLREHGIRSVAPVELVSNLTTHPAVSHPSVVVIIRGVNAAAARHVVQLIHDAKKAAQTVSSSPSAPPSAPHSPPQQPPPQKKFLILTTPRASKIVEKVFRQSKLSHIPVSTLPLGFLPFDADLVTLDWPQAFRQIVLDGDNSSILATAAALSSMATALNMDFATIRSAGAAAVAVAEELLETHGQLYNIRSVNSDSLPSSMQSSPTASSRHAPASAFVPHNFFLSEPDTHVSPSDQDASETHMPTLGEVVGKSTKRRAVNLIIIDRGCDLVSPFLSQGTYEGLLDEAIGLHNNIIDLV